MPLHAYITATVGPSWCVAAHAKAAVELHGEFARIA